MPQTKETESAGGVVLNEHGEIALVRNGPDGFWGFPKGHVDAGEEIYAAAIREIEEETGLADLALIQKLPIYDRFKGALDGTDDTSEHKTIHMFAFTTRQTYLKPIDPANPEARWVNQKEVSQMLTHPKDKAYFDSIGELLSGFTHSGVNF